MSFKLTAKQVEAMDVLSGEATHSMLFGGSRSGKTFLYVRGVVMRALKAPKSRHCILRFRFNHIKSSIIFDTFPKVMEIAFPGVPWHLSKSDWFVTFENGSEIWFGGLDDKERTEKILGNEYSTIYLNECSQIPWNGRNMVVTRLAQQATIKVKGCEDVQLTPRMFYDCNPPNKAHWTYLVFVKKVDPDTRLPLKNPEAFVFFQMNPKDNEENLSNGYLDILQGLSARLQKRFLFGEFADANPNQLFLDETIDKWRHQGGELPDMVRIGIGVDPSGSGDENNADNDEIGICVAGLGTDGNCYVLEDLTIKAGPATWGNVVGQAYDRNEADIVVGEINYGGAMVNHVVQTARPRTPFLTVTASRGKAVRAEPISVLYEQGKVRHVGQFRELEDELASFTTAGYVGERSPNRADALIWVLTALFPGVLKATTKKPVVNNIPTVNYFKRS